MDIPCVADSLLCAFKLRKIGAKRVRGYRQLEKQFIAEGGVISKHYWVEVNGYVFNDNERGFLSQSVEEYYKQYNVTDVEYANIHNIVFTSEFETPISVKTFKYDSLDFRNVLNCLYNRGKNQSLCRRNPMFFYRNKSKR